jgi:N-acetyl-anhydromuramyl-L-alanine amidase AmpD
LQDFAPASLHSEGSFSQKGGAFMTNVVRLPLAAALLAVMISGLDARPVLSANVRAEQSVEAAIASNEAKMAIERQSYQRHFAAAYQQFPEIPVGVLESIAYTKTRWNNNQPGADFDDHHGFAQIYGVMGLYRGQPGYQHQVANAAKLLGVSEAQVIADQRLNILGAAALIAQDLRAKNLSNATPEAMSSVIANAMGVALSLEKANSTVANHVRDSFAYSVLHALNLGADDNGVLIKAKSIQFEKAFATKTLIEQRAPFITLDVSKDQVITSDYLIDPVSETLVVNPASNEAKSLAKSTDYGPALYQQSPFEGARTTGNPTHISMHQMEGFYAGSINEFLTSTREVSAHYLIRNSDGQVTQMVRESRRANHTFMHNNYTLGIEQEGFKGQSNWYSDANYTQAIAIVKNMCARWAISCSNVYRGAAGDAENIQATSLRIKGHQHFPDQGGNRSDPGRFFNWTRFANGISGTPATVLDSFETSEGRFDSEPTASGSTTGISTASSAQRNDVRVKNGAWSEQIRLVDNTATAADWNVRFLSGGGSPASNTSLQKAGGHIGFWVYTAAPGITAQLTADDSDGTEISTAKSIPATFGPIWNGVLMIKLSGMHGPAPAMARLPPLTSRWIRSSSSARKTPTMFISTLMM